MTKDFTVNRRWPTSGKRCGTSDSSSCSHSMSCLEIKYAAIARSAHFLRRISRAFSRSVRGMSSCRLSWLNIEKRAARPGSVLPSTRSIVRSFRRSPAGRLIGTSRGTAPFDAGTAARRPASPPKGGVGGRRELTVISVGFRALCVCLRQTTSPAGAHLGWPAVLLRAGSARGAWRQCPSPSSCLRNCLLTRRAPW